MSVKKASTGGDRLVEDVSNAAVEQVIIPMTTVPVAQQGAIQVNVLPSRGGGQIGGETLAAGATARVIVSKDPARRSVIILATGADIYIAGTQAACNASSARSWPRNIPLPWTAENPIWARSTSAQTDAEVTVISERWTD